MPHPWQQILLDAANIIRVRGLAKNEMLDSKGCVCLMGALYQALCGDPDPEDDSVVHQHQKIEVGQYAQNKIAECLGFEGRGWEGGRELVRWNNADERTAEDVISTLEKAAQLQPV